MCCISCKGYCPTCMDVVRKYKQDSQELPGPIGRCFAIKNICDSIIVILCTLVAILVFMNTWMSDSMQMISGQIAPMDAIGYCRCRDLGKADPNANADTTNVAFEDDMLNEQGTGTANQINTHSTPTETYYNDNFTYNHLCIGDKYTGAAVDTADDYQDNFFVTFNIDDSILSDIDAFYDLNEAWIGDGRTQHVTGCNTVENAINKNCKNDIKLPETSRRKITCNNAADCQPGTYCTSEGFCRYGCESDANCIFNNSSNSKCVLANRKFKDANTGKEQLGERHLHMHISGQSGPEYKKEEIKDKCKFGAKICSPFVPIVNSANMNKWINNSNNTGSTLGKACQSANTCELFQHCYNNKCMYGCSNDMDCPDSHTCTQGKCVPYEECKHENAIGLNLEKLTRGNDQANPGKINTPLFLLLPTDFQAWKIENDKYLKLSLNHTACFSNIGGDYQKEMQRTFAVLSVLLIGFLSVVMDIIANLVPDDHKLASLNVKLYIERDLLPRIGKYCCCCCSCCSKMKTTEDEQKEEKGSNIQEFIVNFIYWAFLTLPYNFIISTYSKVGKDVLGNGKYHFEAESNYDGPGLWLAPIPGFEIFQIVILIVGAAISVIVLSTLCTKYICCYGIYSCCFVCGREKERQMRNKLWYSKKVVAPCNKTCGIFAAVAWTTLVLVVIVWSIGLNFIIPNFEISTIFFGLSPFSIKFPSILFPVIACNFACSVFRLNMLLSKAIKSICPGYKKINYQIKPKLSSSDINEDTKVQTITSEDIGDELKDRMKNKITSEAQKYVVNKVDEKLGKKMGFNKKKDERKDGQNDGNDDFF